MELAEGKTLGRYQLKEILGEGGMGVVYRAYDPNLQRDVAVKVMHPHLQRKPGFKERFLQEAVVAARLKHTSIVPVHDSGEVGGVLFIVMDFIPGANLENMLGELRQQGRWVVLSESAELVGQVAAALDYAHRHGVLHRDIKPGNIMLEPEPYGGLAYRPVLTDLGLAKLLEGGVETQTGTSMGTPAYMSPEQAQGMPVDVRSDVYSLGALLYHLCAGRPPFPARTITEAIKYHVHEPPQPPSQINPRITPELEAIILKALEKDPAGRFATAGQLAQALGRSLPGLRASQASSTVVDAAAGMSLATLLEQSVIQKRGVSVLDEFPAATVKTGQDQIQVMAAGQPAQTLPVNTQVTTVGREADNQIVLDDAKVSRHHVRIEREAGGYRVTDLGSSNGAFLGGVRLLKGVPQEWDPAQPLQVGDTYLKLLRAQAAPGTQVDTNRLAAQARSEERFTVTLAKTQPVVDPGSSFMLSAKIQNQSSQVDHYKVSVEGVPAEWVKDLPATALRCMPNEEQAVNVRIQPPRSPHSRAGRYPLALVTTCEEDAAQATRSALTLTVTPYRQFSSQLQPERVKAGHPGRVRVSNQGNLQETFQVSWSDPANELVFNPPEAKVKVEEGRTAEVEYRARLRQARWLGGEKLHRFSTLIAPPAAAPEASPAAQPQTLPGEIASRGRIPTWLLPLLIILCALLAGGWWAYNNFVVGPAAQATRTADAAAALAATATADNSDRDGDGLIYSREIKYDTNPAAPDSDGDGLKDGEEVDTYHTDPKNRDTDGDTLLDGMEVAVSKTNPNNRDTDGDGLQDNVDPDPGKLPTPTPTNTNTPTPTNTPTTTPTLTLTPTFTPTPPPLCWPVIADLNLRAGPGLVYDTIIKLPANTPLTPLGYYPSGFPPDTPKWIFVRVQTTGQEGWVRGNKQYSDCNMDYSSLPAAPVPPTPTPAPEPFAVTDVQASVNPSSYSGPCPKKFDFTGSISVNGAGTVTYRWERSDGALAPVETINFAAAGSQTVSDDWTLSAPGTRWEAVHVLTPQDLTSNQASFNLTCAAPVETCGGVEVGSFCWYLGEDSLSCEAVCAAHGGYNEATRLFAGSDGTNANCQEVLDTLGSSTGDFSIDDFYETSQGGIGCFAMQLAMHTYRGLRDTSPTTASATYALPGRRRVCACNN